MFLYSFIYSQSKKKELPRHKAVRMKNELYEYVHTYVPSLEVFTAVFYKKKKKLNLHSVLDIGRSVYHFLQYIYIPTGYTM